MLRALLGRRRGLVAGALLIMLVLAGLAVASRGGGADVVIYNGRSQYGDERAFTAFEQQTDRTLSCAAAPLPSSSSACAARETRRPPTCW
jgi:hypothetical protein